MKQTEKRCPCCGQALRFLSNWKQFSGQGSILIGALSLENPLQASVEAGVWACPDCGKVELYLMEQPRAEQEDGNFIAQVKCPYCGYRHDMDDPQCPLCGNRLDGGAVPVTD